MLLGMCLVWCLQLGRWMVFWLWRRFSLLLWSSLGVTSPFLYGDGKKTVWSVPGIWWIPEGYGGFSQCQGWQLSPGGPAVDKIVPAHPLPCCRAKASPWFTEELRVMKGQWWRLMMSPSEHGLEHILEPTPRKVFFSLPSSCLQSAIQLNRFM